MKTIERVIAEGTGRGDFIAAGCFGRVFNHGADRVYKEAHLDGTGGWLERCFAIQKRIGADHPLCEFMPVVFAFKKCLSVKRYTVVMERYVRVPDDRGLIGNDQQGLPFYNDIPHSFNKYMSFSTRELNLKIERAVSDVIGNNVNDLHQGNILWCQRTSRWVVIDPSSRTYRRVASTCVHPKFASAKRAVKQYGNPRRQ